MATNKTQVEVKTSQPTDPSKHLSARHIQVALDEFARSQDLRGGPYRMQKRAWLGMFRVPPGVVLVAVYDGDYERPELLDKGPYHPLAFPIQQQVDLYAVNVRQLQYVIPSRQEYELLHRPSADMPATPVPVRLELMVTMQVVQPELIALEIQNPIAELESAVINEVRKIVCDTKLEDFMAGGALKQGIETEIAGGDCEYRLGIKVLGVQIVDLEVDEDTLKMARALHMALGEANARAAAAKVRHDEELRQQRELLRLQIQEAQVKAEVRRIENEVAAEWIELEARSEAKALAVQRTEEYRLLPEEAKVMAEVRRIEQRVAADWIESEAHSRARALGVLRTEEYRLLPEEARARAAAQAIQRVEEARWIVERAKSDVAAQRIQHSEDLRWMVEVMRLAEEKARSEAAADQVRHASELRWKLEQLQRLGLAGLDGAAPLLLDRVFDYLQDLAKTNPAHALDLLTKVKELLPGQDMASGHEVPGLMMRVESNGQQPGALVQLNHDREQLSVLGIVMTVSDWGDMYVVELTMQTPAANQVDIFAQVTQRYPHEPPVAKVKVNGGLAPSVAAWEPGMTFVSFVRNLRSAVG